MSPEPTPIPAPSTPTPPPIPAQATEPVAHAVPPPGSAGAGGGGDGQPNSREGTRRKWTLWHTWSLLLLLIGIAAFGMSQRPEVAFVITLVLMALFTTVAGHGVVGVWLGALIDERNKLSLSRLQMVLWTIVVLSAVLAAALWNVADDRRGEALRIDIPKELWVLMGISTTSLVGSPLIKSMKTAELPDAALSAQSIAKKTEKARTIRQLVQQGVPANAIGSLGQIIIWNQPWDARLSDLFQGEEIGNAAQLDLAKVQMLFFTLVLVLTYAVTLAARFAGTTDGIHAFPPLDDGIVALLGISHAGYLMNKAVPHSTS